MIRPDVVISAPGAGLGHLTRACAVAQILRALGRRPAVISNSPFCGMVERAVRVPVIRLSNRDWNSDARAFVARIRPGLLVIDTFPFGLRGEWMDGIPSGIPAVCVGRNFHLAAYLERLAQWAEAPLGTARPPVSKWIFVEPISEDLLQWAVEKGCSTHRLAGPVILDRAEEPSISAPGQARGMGCRAWLVAHSGPEQELRLLLDRARTLLEPGEGIIAVSPMKREAGDGVVPMSVYPVWLAKWPVEIAGVVTGGGYNALAHFARMGSAFLPVPFPRRFDRQEERIGKREFFKAPANRELAALLSKAAS